MSQVMEEGPLREVAILTRAVENVLRKLIRLLVGRMSLTRLQEMIRIIFVEEAEAKLKRERPGRNVPLTKLALLTGLDTRTLARALNDKVNQFPMHEDSSFLKGFSLGFKVLDLWINDSRFINQNSGEPIELSVTGATNSFDYLVRQAVPKRGITAQSILERLLDNKMVIIEKETKTVRLNREGINFIGNDELDMIDIGFAAAANLISTISHNVENSKNAENRFFQRSCWTFKLNTANKLAFRKQMRSFLHKANKNAKSAIGPFEDDKESSNLMIAGISMFYFEETT